MQFKPIGAVITLDSASGNHINSAKSVYVSATADATLTLKDSAGPNGTVIGSLQMHENSSIIINKKPIEGLFSTGTASKATKISYPRG
jgi:hypothetical protein